MLVVSFEYTGVHGNKHSFIHSFHWHVQNATIPCCSQELLPFLSVMYFFLPHFPPTTLQSSLTSSCHLFLGLPLNLIVPKFIHNTGLGIIFSSILCTCPNQRNLFNFCLYYSRFFLTLATVMNIKKLHYKLAPDLKVGKTQNHPPPVDITHSVPRLAPVSTVGHP